VTSQSVTVTVKADEDEPIVMTGTIATDLVCLTQVIDGVASELCAENASFLIPDTRDAEIEKGGVFGFGPTPTAGPKSIV